MIAYLDDGNAWAAERLTREPGWVLDAALHARGDGKVFAAYLHSASAHEIAELRLGKKTEQLYAQSREAAQAARPLRLRPAAGPLHRRGRRPGARRRRADRVRRAGPADHRRPPAVPRARQDRDQAHPRRARRPRPTPPRRRRQAARAGKQPRGPGDGGQARARRAAARADRPGARRQPRPRARADPQPRQRRPGRHQRRAVLRLRAARAPTTTARRTRRPGSGSRGSPPAASGSSSTSCAADVTKTRKDGSRGRLRIDYGDHRDPQAAIAWLWKFVDGAKTAGELYGRALVVIAAEQHASRLVVPSSQRMPATRWSSHKDIAAKALRKLAGPHVPASLTRLEQAVKRAHAAYEQGRGQRPRAAARPSAPAGRARDRRRRRRRAGRGPRRRRVAGSRPLAGRLATRWWHALAGVRVAGIGPPAGRAPSPKGAHDGPSASTASRSPTRERDARRKADRDRIEQAARALLTTDGWQRWIRVRASNGLSRYSLETRC